MKLPGFGSGRTLSACCHWDRRRTPFLARSVVFEPVRTPLRVGRPRAAPESLQLQRFWNWRFRIHEVKYGQVVNKDRARRDE